VRMHSCLNGNEPCGNGTSEDPGIVFASLDLQPSWKLYVDTFDYEFAQWDMHKSGEDRLLACSSDCLSSYSQPSGLGVRPVGAFAPLRDRSLLLLSGSPTILGTNVPPKPVMVRDRVTTTPCLFERAFKSIVHIIRAMLRVVAGDGYLPTAVGYFKR
jgi:hypothetical protein